MFALRRILSGVPRLTRSLHHSLPIPPPPAKTAEVPDVPTFLTKIGRDCQSHAAKIESWEHLFSATSAQLKTLGIEPARTRRYIIRWRETYRLNDGKVQLTEQKRGRKIDGGERRRKEVRAKKMQEARKAAKN
ncbi:IGR protein motif-domain-containing protein [Pyronema domesticum]|uniref:Small ribosomal subunit protein mS41 n=1 Tax=Pyronema omphalodes (strain CBS 100304) TaxID=1076935 RepID=U4L204_PYROM|nr:IGR protein motif-domain-containing protein [Pyronema domesticum]CCX10165.1 Similar to Protein FYV4, mitochondrial; acc. no. Q75EY2 [Pyronema omphalodes CBS 100304]